MRHALISAWALVTVALCAAVCGDALTEWLSNSGFWGSGVSDLHQESLVPAACAAAVACAACLMFAIAGVRRGVPLCLRPAGASRTCWNVAAVLLALIVVVLMEGYEVRFGGIGAFDPCSVLVAHALPVVVAYALIAAIVERVMGVCLRVATVAVLALISAILSVGPASAAESTTGTIVGIVRSTSGLPIADARVSAVSNAGRYAVRTDARGSFTLLGVVDGTYAVSVSASGYADASQSGIGVLPGGRAHLEFALAPVLETIGSVRARASSFEVGSTSDTFTVSGARAQALAPVASASGLGNYLSGSVQGAIAAVPGIDEDSFANAILRGGKISDAIFDYDSVPVPQGIVAEPGGNIAGAQLPTTGIGSTTVTLAGYEAQGENALGGIVDEIPATGVYPGRAIATLSGGFGVQQQGLSLEALWATPDLRWRYAFATTLSSEYFAYGDGYTFYPSEAGTYGLALQSRGTTTLAGNVHFALDDHDDLSLVTLVGQAAYNQYGTPYPGETVGAFDGTSTTFPGEVNPNAPVTYASGIRGNYALAKLAWARTSAHALSRIQLYRSQYGSSAGGPFWDDLSYPDGVISLSAQQGARETGFSYDVDDAASDRHDIKYGANYRVNTSFLNQVVPTADEYITSNPTLQSYLVYAGDTWSLSRRFDLTGVLRLTGTRVVPSSGAPYNEGALDPHVAASYRIGNEYSVRVTYDHNTVAPAPLETDRVDSTNVSPSGSPAPFVPLAPEVGRNQTYSFEGGGRTQVRATYYTSDEINRIDVLPYNFRSAIASGESPNGVGVPTNAGELRAHGFELWVKRGGFELNANAVRAYSSSASQFAFNDLNAAAVAAGHLFPAGYVPDLSATLSYELDLDRRRLRITPSLSYESGYPYGNGEMIWIFDPVTNRPEQVPNDNYYNPGYNYYFLKNSALPYNAQSNPYIATLGTAEGNDPNTLRTPPQTLLSLHIENDVNVRLTLAFDWFNVLNVTTPTQLQGNPYLIGPPGYASNGVPTNNGTTPALPWSYGRGGYVPMSYPMARTAQLSLRVRLP
jgi:hypothetical protein